MKHPTKRSVRRVLALACILLGIAGCILPIIPGLPFFVLGGRLLGRRDRQLRLAVLQGRRALRHLRRSRVAYLRHAGVHLTPHWHGITRLILGGA